MSFRSWIARAAVLVFAATLVPACKTSNNNLPPELSGIAPASLSANPRQVVIIARFNKALDPATVTTGNFVLIDSNSAVVTTSAPVYNPVLHEVTLTPQAALGVGTAPPAGTKTYQMNILSGVKGVDGLNFPGAAWQFTVPASDDVSRAPFLGLTGATATVASTTSVDLTWANVTDADGHVLDYEIYMSLTPGGEDFLGAYLTHTPAPAGFPFVVGGLASQTKYYFVVRARDTATADTDVNLAELSVTTN